MESHRFVCEKCGRVTFTPLYSDCRLLIRKDDFGGYEQHDLCPEHRAELVRLLSDFFGVEWEDSH